MWGNKISFTSDGNVRERSQEVIRRDGVARIVELIATRQDGVPFQTREGRNDSPCTIVSPWRRRLRVNERRRKVVDANSIARLNELSHLHGRRDVSSLHVAEQHRGAICC